MTTVLKDSLGGNSKTRMITTVHSEDWNLDESISTCRFAMRVAMIKNSLLRNERMDPSVIIQRLKRENAELRAEIKHLKGGHAKEFLTEEDKETCKEMVDRYVEDPNLNNNLIVHDKLMADECFRIMKLIILNLRSNGGGEKAKVNAIPDLSALSAEEKARYEDQIMKLRMVLQQRENEIMILLNMIDKKGGANQSFVQNISNGVNGPILLNDRQEKEIEFPDNEIIKEGKKRIAGTPEPKKPVYHSVVNNEGKVTYDSRFGKNSSNIQENDSSLKNSRKLDRSTMREEEPARPKVRQPELRKILKESIEVTKEQLMNRQSCFEKFRRSYRKTDALSDNLNLMKELHAKGKTIAEVSKNQFNFCKRMSNRLEEKSKPAKIKLTISESTRL